MGAPPDVVVEARKVAAVPRERQALDFDALPMAALEKLARLVDEYQRAVQESDDEEAFLLFLH